MTLVVPIRLNQLEFENLNALVEGSGGESRSNFIRLLIHREFNRRRGLPKPKPSDYRSIFRKGGRPVRQPLTVEQFNVAAHNAFPSVKKSDLRRLQKDFPDQLPEAAGASRISPHKAVGREISTMRSRRRGAVKPQ